MRRNIIQSKTEPNKNDIWLSEEGLKKYGKNGWEPLGGGSNNSGGSEPYIWDGTTSETIFNELKAAIEDNKQIIFLNNNQHELICSYTEFGGNLIIGTKYRNYIVSTAQVMQLETNIESNNNHTSVSTESYFYNYNTLTGNLILTFNPNNLGGISEYNGEFSFGDAAYNVTFPTGIKWSTDSVLEYKPNHTYQFRILNNRGVMKEFANA